MVVLSKALSRMINVVASAQDKRPFAFDSMDYGKWPFVYDKLKDLEPGPDSEQITKKVESLLRCTIDELDIDLEHSIEQESAQFRGTDPERDYGYKTKKLEKATTYQVYDITESHFTNDLGEESEPEFLVFGKTQEGKTVCTRVRNAPIEVFVSVPKHWAHNEDMQMLLYQKLEKELKSQYTRCDNHLCKEHVVDIQNTLHIATGPCSEQKQCDRTFVKSVDVVYGKPFLGCHVREVPFFRVTLGRYYFISTAKKKLWEFLDEHLGSLTARNYNVFEATSNATFNFMRRMNLSGHGWIDVNSSNPNFTNTDIHSHFFKSSCDYECVVDYKDVTIRDDLEQQNAPLRVMSFDIECLSKHGMPKASKNPIASIAFDVRENKKTFSRKVLTWGDIVPRYRDQDYEVVSYKSETQMMHAIWKYIRETDPDCWVGWYSSDFDIPYLLDRAKVLGLDFFPFLTRVRNKEIARYLKISHTNQKGGKNEWMYICDGMITIDGIREIRKDFAVKLAKYSLDHVAQHVVGGSKDDMPYDLIWPYFYGGPDQRAHLFRYNMKDSELVNQILEKRLLIQNKIEEAKSCRVLLRDLLDRGVTSRLSKKIEEYTRKHGYYVATHRRKEVFDENTEEYKEVADIPFFDSIPGPHHNIYINQEYRKEKAEEERDLAYLDSCQKKQFSMNNFVKRTHRQTGAEIKPESKYATKMSTPRIDKLRRKLRKKIAQKGKIRRKNTSYQGAYVFTPKPGLYLTPVITFDFQAMYPSLMIAYNMCFSTLLRDKDHARELGLDPDKDVNVTPEGYCFVKRHTTIGEMQGIIPMMLENLLKKRYGIKADMKKLDTDDEAQALLYDIMNGAQNAAKITVNSMYGATGATIGEMYCPMIGASTTGYGRVDIQKAEQFLYRDEYKWAKPQIIYGDTDSIMVNTPELTILEAIEFGKKVAKEMNASGIFKKPMNMEYECVYDPYLIWDKKKRYCCVKYTKDDKNGKLSMSGVEAVRFDGCSYRKKSLSELFHLMLKEKKSAHELFEYVKKIVQDLLLGKIPLDELTISQKLSKDMDDYPSELPHVRAAKIHRQINPVTAPKSGSESVFAYIRAPGRKASDKAYPAEYVERDCVQIDFEYYVKERLMGPFCRSLQFVLSNEQLVQLFDVSRYKRFEYPSTSAFSTRNARIVNPKYGWEQKSTTREQNKLKTLFRKQKREDIKRDLRNGLEITDEEYNLLTLWNSSNSEEAGAEDIGNAQPGGVVELISSRPRKRLKTTKIPKKRKNTMEEQDVELPSSKKFKEKEKYPKM
ncbi:MAG: DNA polymerase domain-containing protein [Promethearchaeota archaeon]